jgi:hypothetical protein
MRSYSIIEYSEKEGKGGHLGSYWVSLLKKFLLKFSGVVARPKFKSKFGDFLP